ncbi:MAG: class I SAM-dependent methyltransferase [Anaerolineae bacterium]|nr:class I SAM-dependent methyltransferase [Anaerolineae bacterium]
MSSFNHFDFLAPFYERFIVGVQPQDLLRQLDIPRGAMILDAGGGTGRIAQFLHNGNSQVWVIDLSYKMLTRAKWKGGLLPACAYVEKLPFATATFDRVVMVDAFHHVCNQQDTVREMLRVLKPGGRLIIEEPDIRSGLVKLIALGEKLLGMRSRILSAQQITQLFDNLPVRVSVNQLDYKIWVVADKSSC